jgi:tRNA dimethylallyltransferase
MDIGTAKPSAEERRSVPHHLIDLLDPTERYSAGRFREDALRTVDEIFSRGRIPLLVGGTMLYYRALAMGLDALPPANAEIRMQIDREAAARGWPALHAQLAQLDPRTAARLKPGDAQRIQRALEVHRLTGKSMSGLQLQRKPELPFALQAFSIYPEDRAGLHRRVAARFDAMLKAGLVEELAALRRCFPLQAGMPSMRCVGYRQAWAFLEGKSSMQELRETGIAATRQLAKRQLTWLRSLPGLEAADRLAAALAQA